MSTLEAAPVRDEGGVVDVVAAPDLGGDGGVVSELGDPAWGDERGELDPFEAGVGEELGEPHLMGRRDERSCVLEDVS